MKAIFLIISLAFATFSAQAQITKVVLQASGLTCSMCNLSIKKSLAKLPFIKEIVPDVEKSTYTLFFKENEEVVLDDIQDAVKKAGFSVAKFTFTTKFDNFKVQENTDAEIEGKIYHFLNVKEKTLNGEVDLQIIDKNFVSDKAFKKVKFKIKSSDGKRIFNVTI